MSSPERLIDEIPVVFEPSLFRTGSRYLEAREVLADAEKKKEKGEYPAGIQVLETTVDATHSGKLINGRSYPGRHMKAAASSWTDPYEKPIHTHHQSGKGLRDAADPIGRHKAARYIQTVSGDAWLQDAKHPTAMGTGYLELVQHVTDPDAIQKILDGRYKTVSISFDTDGMYCSICDKDWWKGDGCEHRPGRENEIPGGDGKKPKKQRMHFYTGKLVYDECSYVNTPADPHALVKNHRLLEDALRGIEVDSPPTHRVLLDRLALAGVDYQIVRPAEKESIVISSTPLRLELHGTWVSGEETYASRLDTTTLSKLMSDAVADFANVSSEHVGIEIDLAKEPLMATPETKEAEKKSESSAVDAAKLQNEIDAQKALVEVRDQEINSLKDENQALKTEVTKLAGEVQSNLARRLLDARIESEYPGLDGVKADQKKYEELVAEYAKRSRASIEDALKDEALRVANKPPKKDPVKEIPRASISQESVGTLANTASDERTPAEASKTDESAQVYKHRLMTRFNNAKERSK